MDIIIYSVAARTHKFEPIEAQTDWYISKNEALADAKHRGWIVDEEEVTLEEATLCLGNARIA